MGTYFLDVSDGFGTRWKPRSLSMIVASDALREWIESLNPDVTGKRKAKNIPARIAAFARIVLRLVV